MCMETSVLVNSVSHSWWFLVVGLKLMKVFLCYLNSNKSMLFFDWWKEYKKPLALRCLLKLTKFHPSILFYKFVECQTLPLALFIFSLFHLKIKWTLLFIFHWPVSVEYCMFSITYIKVSVRYTKESEKLGQVNKDARKKWEPKRDPKVRFAWVCINVDWRRKKAK